MRKIERSACPATTGRKTLTNPGPTIGGQATLMGEERAHMLEQIRNAVRVNDAFQEVLDDPASHAVVKHSSLRPLLAEASD